MSSNQRVRHVTDVEMSRGNWGRNLPLKDNGLIPYDQEMDRSGKLERIAMALESLAAIGKQLVLRMDLLQQEINGLNPARQKEANERRKKNRKRNLEKESRKRAEAIYRKSLIKAAVPGEVLSKPVAELKLKTRAEKALMRLNVATIGELILRTEEELLWSKNFGPTSLGEVKEALAAYGLSLATKEDE